MEKQPEWVKKYRAKNVEIRQINNTYYAYRRHNVWDSAKKKSRRITDEYLGKVTPEGIIPAKHKRGLHQIDADKITIKEFGASALVAKTTTELCSKLQKTHLSSWKELFCLSVMRFFHASPLKNMNTHFKYSGLSEMYPDISLNPKSVSELLRSVGSDRSSMVEFMKSLMEGSKYMVVDSTAIFSQAENISYLANGHNSRGEYMPQINMLLLFSRDKNKPVFFRLLPGSINDVSSIKQTLDESDIHDAVFVGDKGFHSEKNVQLLDGERIDYILPLRRNSEMIDYAATKSIDRKLFDGYFFFEKKVVWHKSYKNGEHIIILFLDDRLRTDEQQTFLQRVNQPQPDVTIDEYHEKQHTFGTIAIITKKNIPAQDAYTYLKSRLCIENAFDAFKNIIEADRTYMRTDQHMQGWIFMNFLSLYIYYTIYGYLIKNKLNNKFSPKDVMMHFSRVHKAKIGGKEILTEIPKTTRELLKKMKLESSLLELQH